jgi:hypothetical protein
MALVVASVVAFAATAWIGAATARAQALPTPTEAILLLRVLAYDHNLTERAGGAATIEVVFADGQADSQAMANDLTATFEALGAKTSLSGLTIKVAQVAYSDGFDAALADSHAVALFACSGLDDDLDGISAATQKHHVLSFTSEESYVGQGLSIGLVARSGKGTILVDLPASQAEGASLDADLLGLAQIVRR